MPRVPLQWTNEALQTNRSGLSSLDNKSVEGGVKARDCPTGGVQSLLLVAHRRGSDEDCGQQAFLPRCGARGARQRTSRTEPGAVRAVAVRRQADRGAAPECSGADGTEGTRLVFARAVDGRRQERMSFKDRNPSAERGRSVAIAMASASAERGRSVAIALAILALL